MKNLNLTARRFLLNRMITDNFYTKVSLFGTPIELFIDLDRTNQYLDIEDEDIEVYDIPDLNEMTITNVWGNRIEIGDEYIFVLTDETVDDLNELNSNEMPDVNPAGERF